MQQTLNSNGENRNEKKQQRDHQQAALLESIRAEAPALQHRCAPKYRLITS